MKLSIVGASFLVIGPVLAQPPTHVSPAGATVALGGRLGSLLPDLAATVQQVHDVASFSNRALTVITRLRFRPPGSVPPFVANVEVTMAFAAGAALGASTTFVNNMAPTTVTVVHPLRVIFFPAVTDGSWSLSIPFSQPFPFPGNAGVTWLLRATRLSPSAAYELDAWEPRGSASRNGAYAGCHGVQLSANVMGGPGTQMYLRSRAFGLQPIFGVVLLGVVPIGFDLAPFGAPSCFVVNTPDFVVPAILRGGYLEEWEFLQRIPADAGLAGATLHSQFVFAVPGVNPLGIATSDGVSNQIAAPLGITLIRSDASAQATSGTVTHGLGIAIGLN